MSKIEFVQETKFEQTTSGVQERTIWYTRKDGRFVPDSLSYNQTVARDTFEFIKSGGSFDPVITVLETHEDEKV